MMQCGAIEGVEFDQRSLDGIEDIRHRISLSKSLSMLMPFGTMANIFLGNGVLKSGHNIYHTDFVALAKAMSCAKDTHALPASLFDAVDLSAFGVQLTLINGELRPSTEISGSNRLWVPFSCLRIAGIR